MTRNERNAARNAHRTAAREARIAKTLATLPAGCKVCRRCKGARHLDAWAAMGGTCARCMGRGYDLTPAMARAAKADALRAHLAEVEADGKAEAAGIAARAAKGRRPSRAAADRLARYRADWVATRDALMVLEAA